MHEHEKEVPIWFFIGSLLAVYGALITASGIWTWTHPPAEESRVALWELHADVWWGAALLAIGVLYIVRFRPREGESLTGRE